MTIELKALPCCDAFVMAKKFCGCSLIRHDPDVPHYGVGAQTSLPLLAFVELPLKEDSVLGCWAEDHYGLAWEEIP